MNDRYTEIIQPHTFSCCIMDGTWLHDSRKGYGTLSEDGKSVTWHEWRPPTPEEIAEHERMIARVRDPEFIAKGNAMMDEFYAKFGTSREKISKTILDVIENAPPFK